MCPEEFITYLRVIILLLCVIMYADLAYPCVVLLLQTVVLVIATLHSVARWLVEVNRRDLQSSPLTSQRVYEIMISSMTHQAELHCLAKKCELLRCDILLNVCTKLCAHLKSNH